MFKRILLWLCIALMIVGATAFADDTANLLENPGFEELTNNGLPAGWYTDAYLKRDGISVFSCTGEAKTGRVAALVENLDMNDARFAQHVNVKPNTMYRLSGWVKVDDIPDMGRGANLSIEGVYVFSESIYDTDGDWKYIETYGLTDSDQAEVTVFVRLGGYSGESRGRAAFDDIALEAVTELPAGVHAEAWYTIKTVQAIDAPDEADAGVPAPFWPWLCVLAAIYALVMFGMSHVLQKDRRAEALREAAEKHGHLNRSVPAFTVIGLAAAFLVRLIVAWNVEGYQVDVNCFTAWGNTMSRVGPAMFYQSNWCDYTPGYIYVMGLNGLVARAMNGTLTAAFVHKLVPILCDLIAAVLMYRLATEHEYSRRQAGLLALVFAFNPAPVLNSAAWCQVDSVLCVGLMLVAYLAIHRKWTAVLPMFVLCILVKPQALMLGFLGLAAIILELISRPQDRQLWCQMGLGLLLSVILALVIVLPFAPNQESPLWLFEQYEQTLKSYPYATVNTANLFYLFGGNWDDIANSAAIGACVFFALMSCMWGMYIFVAQRQKMKLWWLEAAIMGIYVLVYAVLSMIGCSWASLGVVSMSMAFALILPIYVRSGNLKQLPLCGAVLFVLLYVFGVKMHERYLFPALFLLGMAFAIQRDRRILLMLIGTSCVLFVNEGIVLDNSIRLGSSMGHLNTDTHGLAMGLSVLNVVCALLGLWTCHSVALGIGRQDTLNAEDHVAPATQGCSKTCCTPLEFRSTASMSLCRLDALLMLVVTAAYSIVTLTTLGSTKAPQNPWKSSAYDEYVYIDLGQHYDDFSMMYFCQVSYSNFAIAVSDDPAEEAWSEEYPAQMAEGMCFSWRYLNPSYAKADGSTEFIGASAFEDVQKLSGRYVRINPKQVGLTINELVFKDSQSGIIPGVSIVGRDNANEMSPYYTNPASLLDEQDQLDGEPSWWNSTYFDEIYHARTAYELLNDTTVYEWTHPPLGKIIMSWFVGLFGMTPFGWRFGGALCGILMLPAMYLLVKQLTKRTDMAFAAMTLMTLDCMHFTQTRIATIDSYPVLFIILCYWFMLRFMQRDIVLEDIKKVLPDLALSGFFMGCSVASKWIGAYAGIGLAVLYFWTCLRHWRMGNLSALMMSESDCIYSQEEIGILRQRSAKAFRRIITLCMWCLLFFVTIPVVIYLLAYADRFADRELAGFADLVRNIIRETEGMLSYHGTPGLGMDHFFYSPWYEWPLMMTPMYYASAAFKPEGMSYAIFCFGNPWVWMVGLAGIGYALYCWFKGHIYRIADREGVIHLRRKDWNVAPAFILIGLLAQFLPWVLVPRGTYIYHYFASVPFLILGTTLLLHRITQKWPKQGWWIWSGYLVLCLIWFIILFPYASGITVPEEWLDFIRDYPFVSTIDGYWQSDFLVKLNAFLEKIPIFPHVYHH